MGQEFAAERDLDVLRSRDFGSGVREVLRQVTRVVPDDQPAFREVVLLEVHAGAQGASADVVEGVVVRDEGAPPVGAELDRGRRAEVCGRWDVGVRRQLVVHLRDFVRPRRTISRMVTVRLRAASCEPESEPNRQLLHSAEDDVGFVPRRGGRIELHVREAL